MSRMQRMSFVLWIACKKVELQSGLGREIDAQANFERALFSRFWFDSQTQKMLL